MTTKKKVTQVVLSPFTTCANDHDLTLDGAYMYDTAGRSSCRQCAKKTKKPRAKARAKGLFI